GQFRQRISHRVERDRGDISRVQIGLPTLENYICHAAKRRSTAAPIRNNLRSWPLRATSISPTGSPPARGSGSEIAQRSKKFTMLVLRETSWRLALNASRLLETSAIVGATIGVVGSTSASTSSSRPSIART